MSETGKLSASVLGQLLLMQSVLDSLPDETAILDFVCRGLSTLPGVLEVAWDNELASNMEEPAERIPLMVGNIRKGELVLRLADAAAFLPYREYLKNFCFMLAVILEERQQRCALLRHKAELEERVEERTAELVRQMAERQQSEERLRLVLEGSQLGFWDWNIETGQVKRNERWAEMLGYTLDEIELSVNQWTDLQHPDDRAGAWKSIEDHLKGLTPVHEIEYRMLGKDGQYRWILDRAKVVGRDAQGNPTRMSGTHSDITVRKMAEFALLEKTEELDHFFAITPDLLCIADTDGYFQRLNLSWEKNLGYSLDELLARPFLDLVHPDDVGPTLEAMAALTSQNNVIDFVNRYRCNDGSYRWFEWRSVPAGKVIYAAARDITERKQAELNLIESERRYRALFENMTSGFVLFEVVQDDQGVPVDLIILTANQGFETTTGLNASEVTGKRLTQVLPGIDRDAADWIGTYGKVALTGEAQQFEQGSELLGGFYSITAYQAGPKQCCVTFQDITERKRAREMLRKSEATLKSIFRVAPIGIGLVSDRIVKQVNDRMCEMLGYSEDELVGRSARIVYPSQEEFEFVGREKYAQIRERMTGTVETRWLRKDGEIIDVLLSSSPLDPSDPSKGVTFTALDITERKRAVEALAESEKQYRQLIEQAADGIFIADPDGRIMLGNSRCSEMLGYTQEELRRLNIIDTYPAGMEDVGRQRISIINSGENLRFERPMKRKDGSLFWAEASVARLEDGRHQAIIHDITERKLAEAEHVRLATAIEQAPEAVIVTDPDWSIRYANPAFEHMTGYGQAESIGLHTRVLKSGLHDKSFYRKIRETLASGHIWQGRMVNKRKDGTLYDAEATASPVRDASGAIINYVMIHRDITKELRLEKALRQSQKMESIGTLAGGIAHDFNNILGAIIGYAQLAQVNAPEESPLCQHLAQVLDAGFRARDLVKQILTFSRRTEEERKPIQFALIVREVMKLLRASLPSTIEIRQAIFEDARQAIVMADPTQIHQVLMNLGTNAAHAMRARGGVLSLELRNVVTDDSILSQSPDLREGSYVCLEMSDTGHGMDAEIMERMFDPYFTTKQVGEGTGLGLSVVQGIVKNHGGAIIVRSEPGHGTTFSVFFPRIEEKVEPKVGVVEALPTGSEKILFVDDEKSLLNIGKEMLESLGYNVTTKESSLEALEIFKADPNVFDLVITDMTMPGLTGKELAERIFAIRKDVPIILCTGFNQTVNGKPAEEFGVRELIFKPYTMATLAKAVRKTLEV